jgi:hypothetical protein
MDSDIANPGSALGEAIGALLEAEIHRILEPLAQARGCIYVTTGPTNPKTGRATKLILSDSDGNEYNVDSVIINNRFQPLVLIESKYIRYKKHNRDKASWICTAHPRLRQRYATVRKSIAVLMGSWSQPSKRLLNSFEVELFEIAFNDICDVLAQYGVDYRWAEKDRQKAMEAWRVFCRLPEEKRGEIAKKLVAGIESGLRMALETALDESIPRTLRSVSVIVRSNRGETFTHTFDSLQQALDYIQQFDEARDMDTTRAPSLLAAS